MSAKSIHDSIVNLLNERLKKKINEKFDRTSCLEIYQDIFYTLTEVFKQSDAPLENEAVNLLAQMYYDTVTINGNQELDPDIFTQRAKFENVPTKQLALLATMMRDTPFSPIFISEVRRRN
jgi:hypothetical protein